MKNRITIDSQKGKKAASLLYQAFNASGIFGRVEMPEDILPKGIKRGSLQHQLFITLTVAIDYQRDANKLWAVSRKTYEDPETSYLFHPGSLHQPSPRKIVKDMQKHRLSKKTTKDAHIWRTVGVTLYKKWNGRPFYFLKSCKWDSIEILRRLKKDTHIYNRKSVPDYPYLRGDKIGPLWLRMLKDNVGIDKLKRLNEVPIPVDIHVARATLSLGVVGGRFSGSINDIFDPIREAWFKSVKGLKVKNRSMITLDIDEPLWHLSKYGCTYRDKENVSCPKKVECNAAQFCVKGKVKIENSRVELNT